MGGDGEYSLDPPYNSAGSSTFSNLADCHEYCYNVTQCFCDKKSCKYYMQYGTGFSRGILASERFIFKSSHNKGSHINDVVLGCSHEAETAANNYNGLLELGRAKHSLQSQLGSDLEGISFGGKMLDIDNEQLKMSNHKGGAAFDSGANFIGVPTVPFHFSNDSTVELDSENIFKQYSGKANKNQHCSRQFRAVKDAAYTPCNIV
ncbi:protein ASPARTIC PROTEASE IN GUARD CELL 1-like [Coffea arabica]|uniref:Protein ASPARTIC PROTEASE IN GUARD CELL 1-like n=1 Tax=Coffea arabica TaxID=13443 RepID=A0ABM4UYR6_COFAR